MGTITEKRLLVTGCGRSGTKYTATLLQKLGLDIRHEKMGADGTAAWCHVFQCDDSPWGGGSRGIQYQTIVHQVRHPLQVIPSLTTFTGLSWDFIARHIDCPKSDSPIVRGAKYWYYWNQEAEKIAEWRYRVERLPQVFEEFCGRIGVPPDRSVLEATSTMVNSRKIRSGFKWARYLLDRFNLGQGSRHLEFLYGKQASYFGKPFTWEVLEDQAPGWSRRIIEQCRRYGYTAKDDVKAASPSRERNVTVIGRERPTDDQQHQPALQARLDAAG